MGLLRRKYLTLNVCLVVPGRRGGLERGGPQAQVCMEDVLGKGYRYREAAITTHRNNKRGAYEVRSTYAYVCVCHRDGTLEIY